MPKNLVLRKAKRSKKKHKTLRLVLEFITRGSNQYVRRDHFPSEGMHADDTERERGAGGFPWQAEQIGFDGLINSY